MVKKPSKALEQRVLKSADRDEASTLAGFLDRVLGLQISIVDLSQRFDTWVQVKRRTYDLWFHLDDGCKERWALASAGEHRAVSPFVNKLARTLPRCPPNTEAKMRVIIPTVVGLVALAATSVQAALVPTNPHPHSKWHETPAQNVRKSLQYDYLVATNSSFRAYRMRKECGPIRDAELRNNCVASFGAYEPAR